MKISKIELVEIDVLILVGGQGKRLRSVSRGTPKPLVKINGKPFLTNLIKHLKTFGFKRIILCTGYKAEYFERFVASSNNRDLKIVISHEETPLGTGGAIRNAKGEITSDVFLVLNGDTFCELDYKEFYCEYVQRQALAQIAVNETKSFVNYGMVELDNNERIIGFSEKPENVSCNRVFLNVGIYLFNKKVFELIPKGIPLSLEKDIMPEIVAQFEPFVYAFVTPSNFIDIGTPENYRKALHIIKVDE